MTLFRIAIAAPFDLGRTARAAQLTRVDRDGSVWHASDGEAGPGTIRVARTDDGVEVSAWGPGMERLIDRVPRLLGLDDDPTRFAAGTGLLRDLHARSLGLRLGSTGRVFDTMLPVIIGQLVTTAEAKASYRSLVRSVGKPAPGPNEALRLPPAPADLASMTYERLHGYGIERKRAQTIIECARRARRLEDAMQMDPDAARKRLEAIRGVGPWTVETVMGAAYGDRDAVPPGDYNLPHMISWALAGEPRGTDERMYELLEPYRPYRRRAVLLVKQSGVKAPRYGPRRGVRTHL